MNKPFSTKVDSAKRLAELRQGSPEPPDEELAEELEFADEEEAPAFSLVSADRHGKIMLELRLLSGNSKALTYSYLVSADFNPSEGIGLDFSGYRVRIKGRNLRPLFEALVAQRVAVVHEMDPLQADASGLPLDAPVVTRIEIAEVE